MPTQDLLTPTLAIFTTAAGTLALYLRHQHQTLRSQVASRTISPEERREAASSQHLESLPQDLLDQPEHYRIIHEQDSIPLPGSIDQFMRSEDASAAAAVLTGLMQRNMRLFATYLPQSYLMRFLLAKTPEQKDSFSTPHIDRLAFEPDDLVCGFYRVLVRRPLKCEMGMAGPAAGFPESFGGRMVTRIVGEGGRQVLRTETLQWVRREEGMVLPLERGAMRWMHEFASWGLLVSGARWLGEQVRREGTMEEAT